jgi:hypothetical protein
MWFKWFHKKKICTEKDCGGELEKSSEVVTDEFWRIYGDTSLINSFICKKCGRIHRAEKNSLVGAIDWQGSMYIRGWGPSFGLYHNMHLNNHRE